MPVKGAPSSDLSRIFARQSPSAIIAAVPLKPAARVVFFVNPTFCAPFRQRKSGAHLKKIQRRIGALRRQLRPRKPFRRKLPAAIGHVFSAEYAESQHLRRRQFRRKIGGEIAPFRGGQGVLIPPLHFVADDDIHLSAAVRRDIAAAANRPVFSPSIAPLYHRLFAPLSRTAVSV